ncbi:diacylglycerol/lipid kinase family protein [Nocardioides sp. NPDC059952]|uniref:diacylglycerol/lipid kinase family protein n=1 Tax=Nocardioides sp. NPDC059952 TaxID=3347014 RepID=UPI003667C89D
MTSAGERAFSFLVNPVSGGGAAPAAVVPVARILRDAGAQVEVIYSSSPRATHDVVEAAVDRGEIVVSVGGDGMLSSIAGQVASRGGTLGILPAGRGNDFARMLALPSSAAEVADLLLRGTARPVDLLSLRLGDSAPRVVAGSVYAGVDAVAGEIVDRVRRIPKRLQYPYAAAHALATDKPVSGTVVVDELVLEVQAATVVVANSAYYGSGMKIAPAARVDDGLLDVLIIEAASRRQLLRSLPKVYDGSHVELPEVTVLRGRAVELSGTPSVPMGADGEPMGHLPAGPDSAARIEVLPGALSILRPTILSDAPAQPSR